jgi:hypothetical protein
MWRSSKAIITIRTASSRNTDNEDLPPMGTMSTELEVSVGLRHIPISHPFPVSRCGYTSSPYGVYNNWRRSVSPLSVLDNQCASSSHGSRASYQLLESSSTVRHRSGISEIARVSKRFNYVLFLVAKITIEFPVHSIE